MLFNKVVLITWYSKKNFDFRKTDLYWLQKLTLKSVLSFMALQQVVLQGTVGKRHLSNFEWCYYSDYSHILHFRATVWFIVASTQHFVCFVMAHIVYDGISTNGGKSTKCGRASEELPFLSSIDIISGLYKQILSVCSFGCKNVLNFICLPMIFTTVVMLIYIYGQSILNEEW